MTTIPSYDDIQICITQTADVEKQLKAEYRANEVIIANKTKGMIRAAQSRNKEIREELETLYSRLMTYGRTGVV